MIFIDTNYFLRFLLRDDNNQHLKAKKVFEEAAIGEKKLFTSLIVFFEIYWVLSSFYKKNKKELIDILNDVLSMSFIRFENIDILTTALKFYQEYNLDLEDSYNIVYSKQLNAKEFKTFDQKIKSFF